jgi:hypothetical protein
MIYPGSDDMANPSFKAVIAQGVLQIIPPQIRETLINDTEFRKENNMTTNVMISCNDLGVNFKRSEVYNSVREIISDKIGKSVTDSDGSKWEIACEYIEGELPEFVLTYGKNHIVLPDLTGLSEDKSLRIHFLDKTASDVNLPINIKEEWRKILSERALEDDEVEVLNNEFFNTPVEQARLILSAFKEGHADISTLVPTSRQYFERLIGAFDGSTSIFDYSNGVGRTFLEQLSSWKPYDGFLYSLLLSSHFSLTNEIKVDKLGKEELIRAFNFIEKQGDRTSQLGIIEIGLRIIRSNPEIEPILINIIGQIYNENVNEGNSRFKLLSVLFALVDGELSRTRLFADEPPLYRRLASLSQAALIQIQILNTGIDIDSFCDWASNNCGGFYLQSLVDMRIEPHWEPSLAEASQMKEKFLGRIILAALNNEQNIKGSKLFDLILGDESESLHLQCKDILPYFPGPLEGYQYVIDILPEPISESIKSQLNSPDVTPSSFIALVNSAMVFHLENDQAGLAAEALKRGNYQLTNIEDRTQLMSILNGLAMTAAVSRSSMLADELRVLVRRYRLDSQYALTIQEIINICLVAASSHVDLREWRNFVGDWITELAFGVLENNDGELLYNYLQYLCNLIPELWVSCGRADAALMAYNAHKN